MAAGDWNILERRRRTRPYQPDHSMKDKDFGESDRASTSVPEGDIVEKYRSGWIIAVAAHFEICISLCEVQPGTLRTEKSSAILHNLQSRTTDCDAQMDLIDFSAFPVFLRPSPIIDGAEVAANFAKHLKARIFPRRDSDIFELDPVGLTGCGLVCDSGADIHCRAQITSVCLVVPVKIERDDFRLCKIHFLKASHPDVFYGIFGGADGVRGNPELAVTSVALADIDNLDGAVSEVIGPSGFPFFFV